MKSVSNIKTELTASIDVETVRIAEKFEDLSEGFQSAWEYKNKQDGEVPEPEKLAELWERNASLYAEFSKVCAVSLSFLHQGELYCREFYGENEKELLISLKKTLDNMINSNSDYRLVAHAGKFFDYPYLCKRYLINDLDIPLILDSSAMKPWETKNLCTNELWKLGGTGAGSSLQALCKVLNIPTSKSDLVGDEVGKSYYNKEYKRIGRYCSQDTIATYNVLRKFKKQSIFQFDDVIYLDGYVDGQETKEEEQPILLEIYNSKELNIDKLKAYLKERNYTSDDFEEVRDIILSVYLDKSDKKGDINTKTKEVEQILNLC